MAFKYYPSIESGRTDCVAYNAFYKWDTALAVANGEIFGGASCDDPAPIPLRCSPRELTKYERDATATLRSYGPAMLPYMVHWARKVVRGETAVNIAKFSKPTHDIMRIFDKIDDGTINESCMGYSGGVAKLGYSNRVDGVVHFMPFINGVSLRANGRAICVEAVKDKYAPIVEGTKYKFYTNRTIPTLVVIEYDSEICKLGFTLAGNIHSMGCGFNAGNTYMSGRRFKSVDEALRSAREEFAKFLLAGEGATEFVDAFDKAIIMSVEKASAEEAARIARSNAKYALRGWEYKHDNTVRHVVGVGKRHNCYNGSQARAYGDLIRAAYDGVLFDIVDHRAMIEKCKSERVELERIYHTDESYWS